MDLSFQRYTRAVALAKLKSCSRLWLQARGVENFAGRALPSLDSQYAGCQIIINNRGNGHCLTAAPMARVNDQRPALWIPITTILIFWFGALLVGFFITDQCLIPTNRRCPIPPAPSLTDGYSLKAPRQGRFSRAISL
jgi:hypothetical protein